MSTIHIEASAIIDAPPSKIFPVLTGYHNSHPAILPKAYFTKVEVEDGGHGAGTVAVIHMNVRGAKRIYRLAVTEPEPGRVLVESDPEAGIVTTFTVDPVEGGDKSRLTIASEVRPSPGLLGFMERIVNPPITRRIYNEELQNIAAYLRNQSP